MRFISRGGRALARCAISVAAVACPLAAASAAQAAIGGASPPTSTTIPDLRSVSLVASNQAQFCFDKVLSNPGAGGLTASAFLLGGYNYNTFIPANSAALEVNNQQCVVAQFPPVGLLDYSIGTVQPNAVFPNGRGGVVGDGNLGDSVPNQNSTSHSGTAGTTTAPNLVSLTVDPSLQTIDFVFDRPLNAQSAQAGQFFFADSAGIFHPGTGTATVVNANQVNVGFGAGLDVRTAKVAGLNFIGTLLPPGLENASGFPESTAPVASLPVPGTSGTTVNPRAISAAINSPNTIDITFDQGIGTVANMGSLLEAYTSNGSVVPASARPVVTGPNTIRATFPLDVQSFYEEFVRVGIGQGVVTGANGNQNVTSGVAVGGNVGAFATGFTNAPDARGVTFDNASGTVIVDFDQRVNPVNMTAADYVLHAADGTVLSPPLGAPSVTQSSGPSDAFVALQYTPQELSQAAFLEIDGSDFPFFAGTSAVSTFGGASFTAAKNVVQEIAPSAPASAFLPVGSHVHSVVRVPARGQVSLPVAEGRTSHNNAHKKHKAHKKHRKH